MPQRISLSLLLTTTSHLSKEEGPAKGHTMAWAGVPHIQIHLQVHPRALGWWALRFKMRLSETRNSQNKQMHRLCKDSNTQMCRLQLNTRTAHFQANHVPVIYSVLLSTVDLTWSEHPLKSRISFFLIPLLKPVSYLTISFSSLKTPVQNYFILSSLVHVKDPNNSWNCLQFVCCFISSPQRFWLEKLVCPGQQPNVHTREFWSEQKVFKAQNFSVNPLRPFPWVLIKRESANSIQNQHKIWFTQNPT